MADQRIEWYEIEVPRGFMGILGKKRVSVCTSCKMGPCLEGQPKCLPNDDDSDPNIGSGAKTDWYGKMENALVWKRQQKLNLP